MSAQHDLPLEELLNGFVDGELDGLREEFLFDRLSADSELRSQLRDMRTIRSATLAYPAVLTPPSSYAEATFSRLDFALIPAMDSSRRATGALAVLGTFFSKYWLHMLAVLTVSVLTFSVVYTVIKDQKTTTETASIQNTTPPPTSQPGTNTSQQGQSPSATPVQATPAPGEAAASSENQQAAAPGLGQTAIRKPVARQSSRSAVAARAASGRTKDAGQSLASSKNENVSPRQPTPDAARSVSTNNAPDKAALISDESEKPARPDISPNSEPAAESLMEIPVAEIGYFEPSPTLYRVDGVSSDRPSPFASLRFPPALEFGFRYFRMTSNPGATVGTRSDPLFQEMSVAARYGFAEHHIIGLEAGQEAFSQHYDGTENGNHVRYEQNMLAIWVAANYQYRPGIRFLGILSPFVSISAGSTMQAWPMLRGEAGFRFAVTRQFALTAGAEGNMLWYPFQSTWFSTSKTGLSFGVAFSLGAP